MLPNLPEFYQGSVFLNGNPFVGEGAEIAAFSGNYTSPPTPIVDGKYTDLMVQTIEPGALVGFLLVLPSGGKVLAVEADTYNPGQIWTASNPFDLRFVGETVDEPQENSLCDRLSQIVVDVDELISDLIALRERLG